MWPGQLASQRNYSVVLQLRSQGLQRKDALNRIASFCEASVDNVDAWISLGRRYQADIAPPEVAYFSI